MALKKGRWLIVAGGAVVAAGAGLAAWLYRSKREDERPFTYFHEDEPEERADDYDLPWSVVGEEADDSLPAGNPPGRI